MSDLEAAVAEVAMHLERVGVPYMVIGGMANLAWGEPRLTQDVDVTVSVPESGWPEFIEQVRKVFEVLPREPLEFMREARVLPARSSSGMRVDFIIGGLPYEEQALARARTIEFGGRGVRVCSPEDLLVLKLLAGRPRDVEDIHGVVLRQRSRLDVAYLREWANRIAGELDRPEVRVELERALAKAGLANS